MENNETSKFRRAENEFNNTLLTNSKTHVNGNGNGENEMDLLNCRLSAMMLKLISNNGKQIGDSLVNDYINVDNNNNKINGISEATDPITGSASATAHIDVDTLFKNEFNDANHINFSCWSSKENQQNIVTSSDFPPLPVNDPIGLHRNNNSALNSQQQVEEDVDFECGSSAITDSTSGTDSSVIEICEEDLVDERSSLRKSFKENFFEKCECHVDQVQGSLTSKRGKLGKSLQRKVISLIQLLNTTPLYTSSSSSSSSQHQNQQEKEDEAAANEEIKALTDEVAQMAESSGDQTSNEKIRTKTETLYKLSKENIEYKRRLFRLLKSIVERVGIDALQLCDQYQNQVQNYEQMVATHHHNHKQQQQTQQNLNSSNGGGMGFSLTSNGNAASGNNSSSSNNNSTHHHHQPTPNINNPGPKLWNEVKSRGCQFLGPQMQDDTLRLILHALDTCGRLSRKLLVAYVVHMLKKHYPKASKTGVGHVVQLLYRAGCFIQKDNDSNTLSNCDNNNNVNSSSSSNCSSSSAMLELRREFAKYPSLRRQHDTQIIQIALETGIRMSPEQWSQKLYGDDTHKSDCQSIIDKLQSEQTLEKLVDDLYEKLSSGNGSGSGNGFVVSPQTSLRFQVHTFNAIGALFVDARADFDFFLSVNFEPKASNQSPASVKSATKRIGPSDSFISSIVGDEDDLELIAYDSITGDPLTNFSFITDNNLDDLDNLDDHLSSNSNSNNSSKSKQKQQQQQIPQPTKIVWSLLLEALQKALRLLVIYMEYHTRLIQLIMANNANNQNQLSTASTTTTTIAVKMNNGVNKSNGEKNGGCDKTMRSMGVGNQRFVINPNGNGNGYSNNGYSNVNGNGNGNKYSNNNGHVQLKSQPLNGFKSNFQSAKLIGNNNNNSSLNNNNKKYLTPGSGTIGQSINQFYDFSSPFASGNYNQRSFNTNIHNQTFNSLQHGSTIGGLNEFSNNANSKLINSNNNANALNNRNTFNHNNINNNSNNNFNNEYFFSPQFNVNKNNLSFFNDFPSNRSFFDIENSMVDSISQHQQEQAYNLLRNQNRLFGVGSNNNSNPTSSIQLVGNYQHSLSQIED